jgi:CRISPR/Cas system-associated protein Cas5 (RAMP superfamily)
MSDAIPAKQFMEACDRSERCIRENTGKLEKKKIIYSRNSERVHRGSPIKEYMFNKHYDTWFGGSVDELLSSCGKLVDNPVDNSKKGCTETYEKGARRRMKRVHGRSPSIDTIQ